LFNLAVDQVYSFLEYLKDLQPLTMTEWERDRERLEFDRAASLYKPMSGAISNRFVSASSHDISHLGMIPLNSYVLS